MNVVGVLMMHCTIMVGSMNEDCARCNQTWGRQTESGKKTLWAITPQDERTFSLGVLQSWRRVLPQLCCSCLNSIHNVKRKTLLWWPPTPQTRFRDQQQQLPRSRSLPVYTKNQYASWISRRYLLSIGHGGTTGWTQGRCFVVPATGPRAVHFKPVPHIVSRKTGSPCGPHGTEAADDSAQDLCNYLLAHLPVISEGLEYKNHHVQRCDTFLLTFVDG